MTAVRDAQHEAEELLRAGAPFPEVEEWIDSLPLAEDDKAAVWLVAYMAPHDPGAGRRPHLLIGDTS